MAATYTPIATTTLGSSSASYTFSSIPSTYTDLVLIVNGTMATADNVFVQFNGDTGSNYSETALQGNGSAASSYRDSSQVRGLVGTMWTGQSTCFVNIMNYANTTTYKTSLGRSGSAADRTETAVTLWRSTSAINSVKFFGATYSMAAGTVLTLYGIEAF